MAAAAALVAVQTLEYAAAPGPDGFVPATALVLALPPQLWLLASWGVRRLVRASDQLTRQLQTRAALSADDMVTSETRALLRSERLRELEVGVLPFLAAIADGHTHGAAAQQHAATLAMELRDSLRARALLDDTVRDAVAAARSRGIRVSLTSDLEYGVLAEAARRVLPDVLALPGLRSLVL